MDSTTFFQNDCGGFRRFPVDLPRWQRPVDGFLTVLATADAVSHYLASLVKKSEMFALAGLDSNLDRAVSNRRGSRLRQTSSSREPSLVRSKVRKSGMLVVLEVALPWHRRQSSRWCWANRVKGGSRSFPILGARFATMSRTG